MSGIFTGSNSGWTPAGWDEYKKHYPDTPALPMSPVEAGCEFLNIWQRPERHNFGKTLFVLVRGIFGNVMPGNFMPVLKYFRDQGVAAIRPRSFAAGTVVESAARLQVEVRPHVGQSDRIVWLCQSRGGLDALWALSQNQELQERTAGVVLVQTPSAASEVMHSILMGSHAESMTSWRTRVGERFQKAIFTLPRFREGCMDLTSPRIDECVALLQAYKFSFPVLSVATWSIEPTSWVDSYYKRLSEIRPGCAHDGQFYLPDQLWNCADQLILGNIDHAQSVMGGKGFDVARFWATLATMLVSRSSRQQMQNPTVT